MLESAPTEWLRRSGGIGKTRLHNRAASENAQNPFAAEPLSPAPGVRRLVLRSKDFQRVHKSDI
jgi:hypothetical protein